MAKKECCQAWGSLDSYWRKQVAGQLPSILMKWKQDPLARDQTASSSSLTEGKEPPQSAISWLSVLDSKDPAIELVWGRLKGYLMFNSPKANIWGRILVFLFSLVLPSLSNTSAFFLCLFQTLPYTTEQTHTHTLKIANTCILLTTCSAQLQMVCDY